MKQKRKTWKKPKANTIRLDQSINILLLSPPPDPPGKYSGDDSGGFNPFK